MHIAGGLVFVALLGCVVGAAPERLAGIAKYNGNKRVRWNGIARPMSVRGDVVRDDSESASHPELVVMLPRDVAERKIKAGSRLSREMAVERERLEEIERERVGRIWGIKRGAFFSLVVIGVVLSAAVLGVVGYYFCVYTGVFSGLGEEAGKWVHRMYGGKRVAEHSASNASAADTHYSSIYNGTTS